jgi:hypothetical protein
MPRIKTFAAAGTLTAADVNAIQDDYERLWASRIPLLDVGFGPNGITAAAGTNRQVLGRYGNVPVDTDYSAADVIVWLDPADYAIGVSSPPRQLILRLDGYVYPGATGPGRDIAIGLYSASSWAGALIDQPVSSTHMKTESTVNSANLTTGVPRAIAASVVLPGADFYLIAARAVGGAVSFPVGVAATLSMEIIA